MVFSVNRAAPNPSAIAQPSPLIGLVAVGVLTLIGFGLFSAGAVAAAWGARTVSSLLASLGVVVTPAQVTTDALIALGIGAALFVFEFAKHLGPTNPLRLAWMYWDTARRTIFDSLMKPAFWFALGAALAYLLIAAIFARAPLIQAITTFSLKPLDDAIAFRCFAGAIGLAALGIGLRSLSDYFLDGQKFLTNTLAKHSDVAAETLAQTPVSMLRAYHGVLRFAGAVSFACESVFQIVVFGLITWGLGVAFPQLALFQNPAALTGANAILFWAERVFSLVDGPNIFGVTLSPLEPNKAVWAFGLTIIFFKLFVISLIVKLFQSSLNLRPRDISPEWAAALEREA